jgi:ABC-type glycerol-3-phosphate transport system permease component
MKRTAFEIAKHATIWLFVALTFYPFYYTLMTSFKNLDQFFHSFWNPALPLHWENYAVAWRELRIYIFNSLYVTTAGSLGTVLGCALSAFAFARGEFPLKNLLFYAIFSIMMIPSVLVLIPLFMWIKDLHLLNTRTGLVLSYIAMGQPFGMIVIKSFFEEVPKDFFESARMDGASFLQQFKSIGAPLAGSIIGTVIIINVLYIWNDYLWPTVVVSSRELKPITTGLMVYFGQYSIQYGYLMAGCILSSLPLVLLFFFTMKYFVAGLMSGALKM